MTETHVPHVEMLWEAHDPQHVLEDRFGFQDAGSAGRWAVATVHRYWGIEAERCERIVMSDRNALAWLTTASGQVLAKWSVAPQRFARLAQIARLIQWLEGQGLPVSTPFDSMGGSPQMEIDGVSMGVQRVIRGALLDVDDEDQVRAAGVVLGEIHQSLKECSGLGLTAVSSPPQPLTVRVTDWLDSSGQHVPRRAIEGLDRLVADAPTEELPTQLVHGDFRSSNVLFAGSEVAAVIDFEEARVDHCIDELARSAVLLGTRFKNWGPVSADVQAWFLSAYQSVRRLTSAEQAWWDILVLWYTLALVPEGDDPTGWGKSALHHVDRRRSTR